MSGLQRDSLMNTYIKFAACCSVIFTIACSNASLPSHEASNEAASDVVSGVFYDDDGQNCVVFISDEAAHDADEASAKSIIISRLQEEEFEVCDGSRPRSAGLYTIVGLDEYDQPDWASSTEHHFFKIKGWSKLRKACSDAGKSEDCKTLTQTVLLGKS